MSELPKGWATTSVGEVLFFNYGKSLAASKRNGGPVDVYGSNGVVGSHDEALTQAPAIIVGRKGSFGEVHISSEPCFPIDTTYYVDHFPATDPGYAYNLLRFLPLKEMNRASAIPGLNRGDAHELKVPLPPLAEQKRIVRKLDTLSDRTTTARKHLTAIAKLVERYREAILRTVFTEIGSTFPKLPLASLCSSITDGDHQAPPKAAEGIPFITISAMNTGWIDLSKATRFVPQSYYEELKPERRPQSGDVLFSVTGSIGIPAPVKDNEQFVFQRHIAILRPDTEKVIQSYLLYALQSPQVKTQGLDCATGIAQLTIPLKGLRAFDVPAPSVEKQREIVRKIETAFAKIDRLAAEAKKGLKLTDQLDERILAKAFAGELVPQDPNDEPASVLLERIREARANAPKKKRPTRKPSKMNKKPSLAKLWDTWPTAGMTFEELKGQTSENYDQLKDELFQMMDGAEPKIRQEFDPSEKVMRLKKVEG